MIFWFTLYVGSIFLYPCTCSLFSTVERAQGGCTTAIFSVRVCLFLWLGQWGIDVGLRKARCRIIWVSENDYCPASPPRNVTRCVEEENAANKRRNGKISWRGWGISAKIANGNTAARGSKSKKRVSVVIIWGINLCSGRIASILTVILVVRAVN